MLIKFTWSMWLIHHGVANDHKYLPINNLNLCLYSTEDMRTWNMIQHLNHCKEIKYKRPVKMSLISLSSVYQWQQSILYGGMTYWSADWDLTDVIDCPAIAIDLLLESRISDKLRFNTFRNMMRRTCHRFGLEWPTWSNWEGSWIYPHHDM